MNWLADSGSRSDLAKAAVPMTKTNPTTFAPDTMLAKNAAEHHVLAEYYPLPSTQLADFVHGKLVSRMCAPAVPRMTTCRIDWRVDDGEVEPKGGDQ
jgi:hypothetical protein